MPPRPPSQQDGLPSNQRMSQSPMSASGNYQFYTPVHLKQFICCMQVTST